MALDRVAVHPGAARAIDHRAGPQDVDSGEPVQVGGNDRRGVVDPCAEADHDRRRRSVAIRWVTVAAATAIDPAARAVPGWSAIPIAAAARLVAAVPKPRAGYHSRPFRRSAAPRVVPVGGCADAVACPVAV